MANIEVTLGTSNITVIVAAGGAGTASKIYQVLASALTANQRSGASVIPTPGPFRVDSLMVFRNQILEKRGTNYSEAADNTSITRITALDSEDDVEMRYVKA